jgi:hypothetical protein
MCCARNNPQVFEEPIQGPEAKRSEELTNGKELSPGVAAISAVTKRYATASGRV